MKFDLQLFAEDAIKNQTSNQLRKGIRSFQKEIEIHFAKIENPERFCTDWNSRSDKAKAGLIAHWQHEIKNFAKSIQDRTDELEKRGEQP